jgi:transposase
MEKIIKQCVGIDVSQKEFDVTFGTYSLDQTVTYLESKKFKNTKKDFLQFLKWVLKKIDNEIPLFFVMEATGVYHEHLACFLYENGQNVIIVLPNRASNYAKTLEVKTITDKEASKYLTRMGLEKKMELWTKPDPIYQHIRQLTREREQLQKVKTVILNQIHAEKASAWPNAESIKRSNKHIKLLEAQISDIETELKEFVKSNKELQRKMTYITSIIGVGFITAVTIVGETNGFLLIKNKRQLVSYAGYDVIKKDSGTSVHSKPRISKKGNKHIRKALHLPALTSIKHNEHSKDQFVRMVQKHGIKMKAAVAIQRKILVLIYTLWKKEEFFDPYFLNKDLQNEIGQLSLP